MEKFIELLNESAVLDAIFENEYQVKFRATKIISKELGFIKWLVENDKINWREAQQKVEDLWSAYWWFAMYDWIDIDCLIMLLAISDEPIELLISVLK